MRTKLSWMSVKVNFTYANNTRGSSLGMAGLPHPLALQSQKSCLWFSLVPTESPMILGLDYLKAAKATVTYDGKLVYQDGHVEQLKEMPSGHWGLALI